jgi:hypothetical protein
MRPKSHEERSKLSIFKPRGRRTFSEVVSRASRDERVEKLRSWGYLVTVEDLPPLVERPRKPSPAEVERRASRRRRLIAEKRDELAKRGRLPAAAALPAARLLAAGNPAREREGVASGRKPKPYACSEIVVELKSGKNRAVCRITLGWVVEVAGVSWGHRDVVATAGTFEIALVEARSILERRKAEQAKRDRESVGSAT